MSLRMIGHDEHYGRIGLGSMTQSATNAFSSAPLPAIIEPDIIIKTGSGRRVLEIDIDDILVWDVKVWDCQTNNAPDIVGGEDVLQTSQAVITKDNNALVTDGGGPTAYSIAGRTFPGGLGAAVAGTAGLGTTVMNGTDTPPYEAFFEFLNFSSEANAAGQVNIQSSRWQRYHNSKYRVDGNDVHKLLTAAHYWLAAETDNLAAAGTYSLGAEVRRMSIDVEEMMFDREVLLSILDALVVSN